MGATTSKPTEELEQAKEEVKPLKPCCACKQSRIARDECVARNGEEKCKDLIEAHKACLKSHGFDFN